MCSELPPAIIHSVFSLIQPCLHPTAKSPFPEQPPAQLKIARNQPVSCSQTLFHIFCPDIVAPQAFSGQVNTMLAGCARVSTLDQNPELQLDALSAAGCERIFEDRASSARSDRPELAEALDWMRKGDTLVVWKLDRLGRSLPQLVATVRQLEERGFGFRSLTEGIDATTASGTLVFHVFGALAQFERDLIRERTMAGLAAARARGRRGGRPSKLTPELRRQAEAMLRDTRGYPFVSDVIRNLSIGRTAFYHHFPKERIRELRG